MSIRTSWTAFEELIAEPLFVAVVVSHNGDGTSSLEMPGGGEVRARGQNVAVGSYAFVRGGEVRGLAPAFNVLTFEV